MILNKMKKENPIRKYLYDNNISLKEMAARCGMNYTTLSMFKNDKMVIGRKHRFILNDVLGIEFPAEIEK